MLFSIISLKKKFILYFSILTLYVPVVYFLVQNNSYSLFSQTPILLGLTLQAIMGTVIFYYIYDYEKDEKFYIYLGYLLFFSSLSICYLAGNSLLFLVAYEVSSFGTLLFFANSSLTKKSIQSIVAYFVGSGLSLFLFSAWLFLGNTEIGLFLFTIGLLIKSAYFGFHFWLPEAHSGPPAHSSASYSGLMINLPILLFVQYVLPYSDQLSFLKYLLPLAGMGVLFGGINSFFSKDAKLSLAYSTIENTNLLWFLAILSGLWINQSESHIQQIGTSLLVILYISIVHHSLSKIFQFLSIGYLCKIGHTTEIDELKGLGRKSGLNLPLLGIGAFSFGLLPGTTGFLAESSFLFICTKIIDLNLQYTGMILPSLIFILMGLAFGSFAHLRLYLTTSLSTTNKTVDLSFVQKSNHIQHSLIINGALIFIVPILIWLLVYFISPSLPNYLISFFNSIFVFVFIFPALYLYLILTKYKKSNTKKILWDCGTHDVGTEVSIPASVISDPLRYSIGRYFQTEKSESKLDRFFYNTVHRILSFGKHWINFVESGSLSFYILFSALSLLISIGLLYYFR